MMCRMSSRISLLWELQLRRDLRSFGSSFFRVLQEFSAATRFSGDGPKIDVNSSQLPPIPTSLAPFSV